MDSLPSLDGVEHRFIELPGLRMHVAEAGAGDPVLLLHGFPQHWWAWRGVIPRLSEQHRVIVPDLRGAGWTDAPAEGYHREQLVADVVGLLDALDVERVHLVAHDWSALIGYFLCMDHPERVRSYLDLAIPHPYVRFGLRALPVFRHLWFQYVVATPGLGSRLLGSGDQRFARYLLQNFSANPDAWTEADIELFLARFREPARARAAGSLYRGLILPEVARIARGKYRDIRLTTATVLMYGSEDPVMRLDLLGGYEDHTDDFTLRAVEGASHFIPDDQPDAVVDQALELFARV